MELLLMNVLVLLFSDYVVPLYEDDADCYVFINGRAEYTGEKNTTKSGLKCQRWDRQWPHPHPYTSLSLYPDISLRSAQNYCRDPDASGFPWCLTTDPNIVVERCATPICPKCYATKYGKVQYTGKKTWTKTRLRCQRWDKQTPHKHAYNKAIYFPDKSVTAAENYCRDPSQTGYPWCYTTDPRTLWMSCGIPKCPQKECYLVVKGETVYTGRKNTTKDGLRCQRWDQQWPHNHKYTNPALFPDESLNAAENYCRDPNNEGEPWCLTTNRFVFSRSCGIAKCLETADWY